MVPLIFVRTYDEHSSLDITSQMLSHASTKNSSEASLRMYLKIWIARHSLTFGAYMVGLLVTKVSECSRYGEITIDAAH